MSGSAPPVAPYEPSEEARKFYREFVAELEKRQLSGSENFDKSVLTLSSAGLGLSISFLKDFAAFQPAVWPGLLYTSWGLFTLATVCTMASFLVSGRALEFHKVIARKAYLEGDETAFSIRSNWDRLTGWLNMSSAVAFGLALIATVAFIFINIESYRMTNSTNRQVSGSSLEHKGLPVPTMHRPAPAPAPAPSAPAQPASK